MQKRFIMAVAWPSFLIASALEMAVFIVFDPQDAHWLGLPIETSRQAVYSLYFFIFWGLTIISSALAIWLSRDADIGVG